MKRWPSCLAYSGGPLSIAMAKAKFAIDSPNPPELSAWLMRILALPLLVISSNSNVSSTYTTCKLWLTIIDGIASLS